MGVKDEEPKRPPKKLLYYYGIILLITVLLNALVLPKIAEKAVVKVSYDSFLEMVDPGKVEGVVRGDDQMQFWLKGSLDALRDPLGLPGLAGAEASAPPR